MDTHIKREWCEEFDTYSAWGTVRGLHYRCRRCGRAYQWSGFTSIKVGPCFLRAPLPVYDASLT